MRKSQSEKPADIKAFIIQQLKVFGILLLVLVLGGGLFGYFAAGWEAALNGAVWGLVMAAFALPMLALLISARYWGEFAGRWGAARRGESAEPPQEEEDLPPYKFD